MATTAPEMIDRETVISIVFERERWNWKKAEQWLSKSGFRTDLRDFSDPDGDTPGYLYYEQRLQDPHRRSKWVSVGRDDKGIYAIVDAGRDVSPAGPGTREPVFPGEVLRKYPETRRKLAASDRITALEIARMAMEDAAFMQSVEREFGMSRMQALELRENLNDYLS